MSGQDRRVDPNERSVLVLGVAFMALHATGCFLAYSVGGWEATVYTIPLPIIGPIYWGVYVWAERGLSLAPAVAVFGSLLAICTAVMVSRSRVAGTPSRNGNLVLTPHFQPFSDDEWRRVTTAVREQVARGELDFESPERVERSGMAPPEIHAVAKAAAPEGRRIRSVQRYEEISVRRPNVYNVDLVDCWIAYLDSGDDMIGIKSSDIVAIRGSDGTVVYVGPAGDEG